MDFKSEHVQRCAVQFHTVSFAEARESLNALLAEPLDTNTRTEALSLLLRINIERDEPIEMGEMLRVAKELITEATKMKLSAALYHLGIVGLLADDPDTSELCFSKVHGPHGAYGLAAVLHKRRDSDAAVRVLQQARKPGLDADTACLLWLLEGNCQKGLGRTELALNGYREAQGLLPYVKTFYLKHWVFFGLATIHARRGEKNTATTLLEALLSITHPIDFKRLHRLAEGELNRISCAAELLFDAVTGDITCGRGYLSLRRKPILINLLFNLVRSWPESVSKEEIYTRVWRGEYHPLRHDGLIYSHMQRLRQILCADHRLKDFILTTQDGYRLNPEIPVKLKEESHELPETRAHAIHSLQSVIGR